MLSVLHKWAYLALTEGRVGILIPVLDIMGMKLEELGSEQLAKQATLPVSGKADLRRQASENPKPLKSKLPFPYLKRK